MTTGLLLCLPVALILMICILVILRQYLKLKRSYDALLASYRNLEELNSTLRMQRHDYLNHLQVIYGMTELQEYGELKRYLDPLYKDMLKTGKALRTANPAINALIRAKSSEAEHNHIDVYIEVKSDLKRLDIPDWELCKVLSNIIDNGITALKEKDDDRKLWIDITESMVDYKFEIANNGPMIEIKMQSMIFQQGVTTKQDEGHGMGLFIVSNVLRSYKGKIELKSDEEQTCFRITLPKKMESR